MSSKCIDIDLKKKDLNRKSHINNKFSMLINKTYECNLIFHNLL